jgi:hypothetical protein
MAAQMSFVILYGCYVDADARVRSALQDDNASHVHEWLRRRFHAPATLPPFSIVVSSILRRPNGRR